MLKQIYKANFQNKSPAKCEFIQYNKSTNINPLWQKDTAVLFQLWT